MMSISATLFGEILHASLFFYWPAAEPSADARGTLGFRGTLGSAEPRLKNTDKQ